MSIKTETRREIPTRLLAALRGVGVPEEEIRRHYGMPPDEPFPDDTGELLTVEDMELLPRDDHKYELWEGKLLRMSPTKRVHGRTSGRLVRKLAVYLEQHPIGEVYIAEAGFRAGPRESLYCPDASFISSERDATLSDNEFVPFAPDIAIEVWSPDDTEEKMATKVTHYLAHGARRVWVLRPQDRTLRVYRLDGPSQVLQEDDLLTGDEVLPGFTVRVGDLFDS